MIWKSKLPELSPVSVLSMDNGNTSELPLKKSYGHDHRYENVYSIPTIQLIKEVIYFLLKRGALVNVIIQNLTRS